MKEPDEDIRKRLSSLPRVGAPPDFEEKLRRRISSGRGKESRFRLWTPGFAVPAATLVVVGVLSSVVYMTQFRSAVELGDAKVYPCSMAVDMLGVQPDELEPWLGEPMGLTKFLSSASGGQVWTF